MFSAHLSHSAELNVYNPSVFGEIMARLHGTPAFAGDKKMLDKWPQMWCLHELLTRGQSWASVTVVSISVGSSASAAPQYLDIYQESTTWEEFIDLMSCVVFSCRGPPLPPTEQLVLSTIRQEASQLQDPGQGAGSTMRARLTDRFDKSEFAQIGLDDAPVCERSPKVHVPKAVMCNS